MTAKSNPADASGTSFLASSSAVSPHQELLAPEEVERRDLFPSHLREQRRERLAHPTIPSSSLSNCKARRAIPLADGLHRVAIRSHRRWRRIIGECRRHLLGHATVAGGRGHRLRRGPRATSRIPTVNSAKPRLRLRPRAPDSSAKRSTVRRSDPVTASNRSMRPRGRPAARRRGTAHAPGCRRPARPPPRPPPPSPRAGAAPRRGRSRAAAARRPPGRTGCGGWAAAGPGAAVTSRSTVSGGGSSSVLRKAFWAWGFIASAGSRSTTFRGASSGRSASRSWRCRTWSTRISRDGTWSKSLRAASFRRTASSSGISQRTSGWWKRATRVQAAHVPHPARGATGQTSAWAMPRAAELLPHPGGPGQEPGVVDRPVGQGGLERVDGTGLSLDVGEGHRRNLLTCSGRLAVVNLDGAPERPASSAPRLVLPLLQSHGLIAACAGAGGLAHRAPGAERRSSVPARPARRRARCWRATSLLPDGGPLPRGAAARRAPPGARAGLDARPDLRLHPPGRSRCC